MGGLAELQVWRKVAIKIRTSSRVFVQFLNAFNLPGLGAEGSTSFASCFAGSWASVVIVSLPVHILRSDVQWSPVPLLNSLGQPRGRAQPTAIFLWLDASICPSHRALEIWRGLLPCLLLPSSFPCMCFLSCNTWDGSSLQSHGLGTAPAQTPCLCALLSVLARRGKLSPCWTGSLSSCCSNLRAQEMCVAKLLYGTFVKHALTVCKRMVFKQQSLYHQMQPCRLYSLGWKASEVRLDVIVKFENQWTGKFLPMCWTRAGSGRVEDGKHIPLPRLEMLKGDRGERQGRDKAHSLLGFVCCL